MLVESIRLAIEALSRNALRSALTTLGVLIGAGAVIAMITIGQGASVNVRKEIARLGAEVLTLSVGQQKRGGQGAAIAAAPFDYSDIEAIRAEVRGLRHVAPFAFRDGRVAARNVNWSVRIIGTESSYFQARDWALAGGRLFTDDEMYNGKAVCIIGETVRYRLYGNADGVGEYMRVGTVACTVAGVLKSRGQAGAGNDDDNIVAIPFDTFQRRIQGATDIQSIVMSAFPTANMERVKMNLAGLMRERRGVALGETDDFSLLDMRQVAQSMTSATHTMTLFLGAIAAVSLVVGGIGIMNIMLVSVTERTREIGVRLTIGALPSQIRMQFLCEAVLLTLAGGLLGIIAGLTTAAIAAPHLSIPFVFEPGVVIVTVAISTILGVGFGFAPAAKASALDPIDCLRHV
ncbi:MAG: multidrug ABC transporter substrate-binding protein [Hyphomicrobium sp. 32-62-53]|nr:MAG: multidrug ABC transporter substrate-binding protein [Hyphomicrobium sp. 12-62-95]OYX97904.1 MAG: multidrug ABC transporter substrate-binding protein [Hyphomicrobium sp. 32-62-53]